jgi:PAS domain S-box-containing protein
MSPLRWVESKGLDRSSHSTIIRYTLLYILISVAWISLSDWLVMMLTSSLDLITTISIAKGWFFVGITALFWHGVMVRNARMIKASMAETEAAGKRETKALLDLRKSEQQFKTLVERSPDMITRFDPDLRALFVNRAVEVAVNLPSSFILGRTLREVGKMPPEQIEDVEPRLRAIFDNGTPIEFESTMMGPQGTTYLLSHGVPERDDDGRVVSALVIHRDITDQKHRELLATRHLELIEFSRSQALDDILRKTVDLACESTHSPAGFYHFVNDDQKSLIAGAWSSLTTREFGRPDGAGTPLEIGGAGVWAECVSSRHPAIQHSSGTAGAHGVLRELVVPVIRGGKVVAIIGVGNKAVDYGERDLDAVRYLADISWEIVGRKRADDERRRLEHQLIRSQKLEAIGTLSSGIAHDFNNILNVIMGNAGLIESYPNDGEMLRNRIDAIKTASTRAARLVQQLLTFARKSDTERRTIDLNDAIREIARLLEETFPKTISVTLDLDDSNPQLHADPNQLHQVFLNLSLNARDAMPQGGEYLISSRAVRSTDLTAILPAIGVESYAVVTLKDSGVGIDADILKQIFDPFFTTKEIGKGTGLGLAVALGIVENHGGQILVSSSPGAGTEFRMYFPMLADDAPRAERKAPETGSGPEGNETVLVIEDEEMIRDAMTITLTKKGYTVMTAADGAEGIETFSQHRDRIDVVLSDRGLPKIWGEDVWRQIKKMKPGIPFLLLTGFIEPHRKDELLKEGIRSVINKPFTSSDLLLRLREVLDERLSP